MAKKSVKKASLGWFFWVAFIVLVALLFFINKDNIKSVLEKTNAKKIFQNQENSNETAIAPDLAQIQQEIEKITAFEEETETKKNAPAKTGKKNKRPPIEDAANETALDDTEPNDTETQEITGQQKTVLFFVHVGNDGKIVKKAVKRELTKTDSPMSTALSSLLKGPTLAEAKRGFRSFIPPETRLLSAYVKNGTAIINLSEEFQFNQYGIEAYQAQLAQIVFTVCEFPTVDAVQFLIEGEKKQSLGGEGVWIGSPLSVNSF